MNLGIVVPSFNRYPKTKRFLRCLEAQTDNDDAIIKPDFLQKMKEIYERNHCRILGARIDYANEPVKIWTLGGSCNWEGKHLYQPAYRNTWEHELPEEVRDKEIINTSLVCGDGTLIDVRIYEEVGFYQEKLCPHNHADFEFIIRVIQHGIKVFVAPQIVLYNDICNGNNSGILERKSKTIFEKILMEIQTFYFTFFHKKSEDHLLSVAYIIFRYSPCGKRIKTLFLYLFDKILVLFITRYVSFTSKIIFRSGSAKSRIAVNE